MKVSEKIIQIDNNKKNPLRLKAKDILKSEFNTPHLNAVLKAMKTALSKQSDGVAIAAPQIGLALSIFVISENIYPDEAKYKPVIFINPKIIKKSKKTKEVQEGCLSVRWIYGTTKRHTQITIKAHDENGNFFTYGASGVLAHICQHECDHLKGVLFIDHGFDFQEYSEEEIKKMDLSAQAGLESKKHAPRSIVTKLEKK
jgi:peptide deformylase